MSNTNLTLDDVRREGLTNDLFEYSEIVGPEYTRLIETYCSSWGCAKYSKRKMGSLVNVSDEALKVCPICTSPRFLAYRSKRVVKESI